MVLWPAALDPETGRGTAALRWRVALATGTAAPHGAMVAATTRTDAPGVARAVQVRTGTCMPYVWYDGMWLERWETRGWLVGGCGVWYDGGVNRWMLRTGLVLIVVGVLMPVVTPFSSSLTTTSPHRAADSP